MVYLMTSVYVANEFSGLYVHSTTVVGVTDPDPGSEFFHSGSRIRIFFFPDPGSEFFPSRIRNFFIPDPKFPSRIPKIVAKLWVVHPGSGSRFLPIPDPGVKKAPDPGSGSATLVGGRIDAVCIVSSTI